MSGVFVDYVRPDKPSGILIYRRRFPQELVPFIPRTDGRGMGRRELRVSLLAKNMDDSGVAERWKEAKAEFDQIVASAEKAAAASHKRATGSFDTLSAPEIAYLQRVEQDYDRRRAARKSGRPIPPPSVTRRSGQSGGAITIDRSGNIVR